MNVDLTHGSIFRGLLRFSLPLMAGNLLQQLYNLVDTFVVGRYCGEIALAAVGSAFSVMILLTSIVTGLCMGSGVVVSQLFGQKDDAGVRKAVGNAFVLIAGVSALLTILSYALLPVMMALLRIPPEAQGVLSRYLLIVFIGIIPTFLYNFGACMLRAVGNSTAPLVFLLISSLTNVVSSYSVASNVGYDFSIENFRGDTLVNKLTSSRITWDKENKKWVIHNWKLREIEGDKETYTTGQKLDTVMAFQPSEFSENPKKIREQLTFPELDRYIDRMKMRGSSNVIEFQIEKYKMIANAFATFILTFIGVSISSRKIRGGMGLHLGIGLLISFSYILFMQFSTVFATNGNMNPLLAVWLPNILFAIIGVFVYRTAPK